jgi:hypothetical protein
MVVGIEDRPDRVGPIDPLLGLQVVVPEIRSGGLGLKFVEIPAACSEVKDTSSAHRACSGSL